MEFLTCHVRQTTPAWYLFAFILLPQVLRENEMLRREVEVKESKLSSSMNSIKTFWSPELKKERALRKDEVSKITVWKEQYRVIQDEAQVSVGIYVFEKMSLPQNPRF